MNPPHTHPRATEIQFNVNGTLRTGMITENGARFIMTELNPGGMTIFPQGSIHFQVNEGCGAYPLFMIYDSSLTIFHSQSQQCSSRASIARIPVSSQLPSGVSRTPPLPTAILYLSSDSLRSLPRRRRCLPRRHRRRAGSGLRLYGTTLSKSS